eukprot:scaffold221876_cov21-Tisochrysis_lutea.AAC.1
MDCIGAQYGAEIRPSPQKGDLCASLKAWNEGLGQGDHCGLCVRLTSSASVSLPPPNRGCANQTGCMHEGKVP